MPYVEVTEEMKVEMGLRFNPSRGSHLPVLMKAVALTDGPILELGCGLYSTTPLHWACQPQNRKLVTYENNPAYFSFAKSYERDFHEVHCIDDWDAVDLSGQWSVAFVDHEPGPQSRREPRRWKEAARLAHAEYVVVHDSEGRHDYKYGFSKIEHLFKYQFEYTDAFPHTTVYSNFHDVSNFINGASRSVKRDGWFKRYQQIEGIQRGKRKLEDRLGGFNLLDFHGKTVLDLGCNIGQMSLYAAACGAESVLGIEYDAKAFSDALVIRKRRQAANVKYKLDDLDNPLCWHEIEPHDTVLLLSVIDTQELTNRFGVLSRACMKCKSTLYLEGHEGHPTYKYVNYVLDNTDFTQIEHMGRYDGRDLLRCSRKVLTPGEFQRTLAEVCKRYNKIAVVGNRRSGKTELSKSVNQPGFTMLDDCSDMDRIKACEKLILFDYRAAMYLDDAEVIFNVLQPRDKWDAFRKYALRSSERAPSNTLRMFYTVRVRP